MTHWLDVQDCELLNTPDETTYTHYFENPSSVIDLTFTTSAMLAFVKDWQINEEIAIGSDHEVIQFVISTKEAEMVESSLNPPYNTAKADWTKFAKQLQQESAKISDLAKTLSTNSKDLKEIAISFRNLILDAANQHISKRKPSIKAKVWWRDNLNSLRKSMFIVKRDWKFNQTEDNWKKVISHKNKYFHAIQTAKQASWTTFLQGAVGKDVFTAYHFIKPRKVAKIPPIQHENHLGITFQEKSKMFLKAMFPPPSESAATALKSDDSDTIAWNTTTFKEVEQAIKSSSPRKAPEPDGIFFLIIHQAFQAIPELFHAIFAKFLNNDFHSTCWRQATGIILRKKGKSDYSAPKAYWIIMLLNCLGKISEKIIATRLSKLAEVSDLLHKDQMNGRRQRFAVNAALCLTHDIQLANHQKRTLSALLLDVKEAFDHVSLNQLLKIMQKLHLPHILTKWVQLFLSDQTVYLFIYSSFYACSYISYGS